MTHLPYIVGSYGLALVLAFTFGISAWTRTARATKRLAQLDTRRAARREGTA
jgi:uncharacterized membrane protein